jgi:hypothetical protein
MAINFPNTPTQGDTYDDPVSGLRYFYDGEKWLTAGSTPTFVKTSGDTMTGDLTVPNITVPNTGVISAMQTPKAILHFGVVSDGTVTINTNYNIDSVVFEGTGGDFTINFTNPLPPASVISASASRSLVSDTGASFVYTRSGSSTGWKIGTLSPSGASGLLPQTSKFYYLVWYGFD